MKLALVGVGYWGKNLLRNLNDLGVLKYAFDLDLNPVKKLMAKPAYKNVVFDVDWEICLSDDEIRGVVIATPPDSHFRFAKEAMLSGKDVFIEKPMTLSVAESEELVDLAKSLGRVVLVGHIFLYCPEIAKLKELVDSPDFGDVVCIYTNRLNMGKVQACGVMYDLAPHDISIVNYLTDSKIAKVSAHTFNNKFNDVADTAFITMTSENGVKSNLNLSWLVPHKTRDTIVVGEKQTALCDSIKKEIRLYKSTVKVSNKSPYYSEHLLNYKYGDIVEPYIDVYEPLTTECEDFIRCVKGRSEPKASAKLGLDVVKTLSALEASSALKGAWVNV